MIYIYLIPLIFIMLLTIYCIYLIRDCPKTIKVLAYIASICEVLRMLSLAIAFFKESSDYLEYLKYIWYLNFISIPLMIAISMYVFWRNSKVKAKTLYIVLILNLLCYMGVIFQDIVVEIFKNYTLGYVINFNTPIVQFVYCAINLIALVSVLFILLKNKFTSNMLLILAAAMFSISEIVITLCFGQYNPQNLLGEVMWVIIFFKAIECFSDKAINDGKIQLMKFIKK